MPSRTPTPSHRRDAESPITVVLVEDDDAMRRQLVLLLESCGMSVVAAVPSAREGGEAVAAWQPAVAVIDNHLPDGRGVDLCRTLHLEYPGVALLIHSGLLGPDEEGEAMTVGAVAVIPKTIRGDLLIDAIRSQVE
jgi:two-component system, NarL family, response regulator DevR